jgi:triosephosphate isomerase
MDRSRRVWLVVCILFSCWILTRILDVGETFNERKEGQTDLVLMHQVYQALKDVKLKINDQIIVAYEPVWVIGTGQAISAKEAFHAAAVIEQSLLDIFEGGHEEAVAIIYGGSVNPNNIHDFSGLSNIRGVLVGGASLNAKNFIELIKNI